MGSLGFPIVVSGVLFWYINKTMKELSDRFESAVVELTKSMSTVENELQQLQTTIEIIHHLEDAENGK